MLRIALPYGMSGTEFLAYSAAVAQRATIETARLLLRPWQPDDLAEFTRLLTDPVVTRSRWLSMVNKR